MTRNTLLALWLTLAIPMLANAQSLIRINNISYWYGYSSQHAKQQQLSDINFLPYLQSNTPTQNSFAGIGLTVGLGSKTSVDFLANRGMNLYTHLQFTANYRIKSSFGISLGGHWASRAIDNSYKENFTSQPNGFTLYVPDMYAPEEEIDYDTWVVWGGPFYNYTYRKLHIRGLLGFGASQNLPFEVSVGQKFIGSNLRRELRYNINKNIYLFLKPEICIGYDIFEFESSTFGANLTSNMLIGKNQLSYTLTEYVWTNENSTTQKVDPPKTLTANFMLRMAFYWRF